jgi:hypothetical protein
MNAGKIHEMTPRHPDTSAEQNSTENDEPDRNSEGKITNRRLILAENRALRRVVEEEAADPGSPAEA